MNDVRLPPMPLNDASPRAGMRRLVYVNVPVITSSRTALIVTDESDMLAQLEKRVSLAVEACKGKPAELDKQGKIVSHPLSPDWDK